MVALPRVARSFAARVRERGPAAAVRVLRLTGAAVAAYLAATLMVTAQRPVTAALTALLVVQVTLGVLTVLLRKPAGWYFRRARPVPSAARRPSPRQAPRASPGRRPER